jgi:hypothetical protein
VTLAEASHPKEVAGLPVTEWLFEPTDVEREEIGLRVCSMWSRRWRTTLCLY